MVLGDWSAHSLSATVEVMRLLQILLVLVCVLGQLVGTCYARDLRTCCRDDASPAAAPGCGAEPAGCCENDFVQHDPEVGGAGGACCRTADASAPAEVTSCSGAWSCSVSWDADGPPRAACSEPASASEASDDSCPLDCEDCVLCACCTLQMNATVAGAPKTCSRLLPSEAVAGTAASLLSSDPSEIPHVPRHAGLDS